MEDQELIKRAMTGEKIGDGMRQIELLGRRVVDLEQKLDPVEGSNDGRTYDWNGHSGLPIALPQIDDTVMAGAVRMLGRNDINHESVCCAARDRIMALVKEKQRFREEMDSLFDERQRRIYYQNIVYVVCNALDKIDGNLVKEGTGIVCGTSKNRSTEVEDRMDLLVKQMKTRKDNQSND